MGYAFLGGLQVLCFVLWSYGNAAVQTAAVWLCLGSAAVGAIIAIGLSSRADDALQAAVEERQSEFERHRQEQEANDRQRATAKLDEIVSKHLMTLARRRAATVRVDHYGVSDRASWEDELRHFIDKVLIVQLSDDERSAVGAPGEQHGFGRLIEERIDRFNDAAVSAPLDVDTLTPIEFEEWCSTQLRLHGWSARLTPGSGDQGADVVATRGNLTVALQCKLYTAPVGNKAVQEVFASARHYGADFTAVVTNSEYTRAARELAGTTGVVLLHYTALTKWAEGLA